MQLVEKVVAIKMTRTNEEMRQLVSDMRKSLVIRVALLFLASTSLVSAILLFLVFMLLLVAAVLRLVGEMSLQLHLVLSEIFDAVVAAHVHEFAEAVVEAFHGEHTPFRKHFVSAQSASRTPSNTVSEAVIATLTFLEPSGSSSSAVNRILKSARGPVVGRKFCEYGLVGTKSLFMLFGLEFRCLLLLQVEEV